MKIVELKVGDMERDLYTWRWPWQRFFHMHYSALRHWILQPPPVCGKEDETMQFHDYKFEGKIEDSKWVEENLTFSSFFSLSFAIASVEKRRWRERKWKGNSVNV